MICWLWSIVVGHRHKWSEWETLESRLYGYCYWLIIQQRKCSKCGKIITNRRVG